ncbi:ABC transporter substrate-binding protein [Thioclava sp. DLFJ5-1]|uniref:extracellular solute-binding protein n=1 Tax=Thioclava sp. DLFJ5-1 TaxID=1915314 RepID=UPI000997E97C|nr:extracellular solute-binding protein [Thioclava sp. DLFJ5-1]OOY20745.1 ABC transporter substrate-binding protein [Thioclava sp. DLFJ5-1]
MTRSVFFHLLGGALFGLAPVFTGIAAAEPQPAIAMYGEPALPAGFTHLPYANPDAPKGGEIRFGVAGMFDSLNPWILNGRPAEGIGRYVAESLMGRSMDEPFTLYGLLAESVETDPDRTWVEFTLRPEAKFSDGNPVTVADVIWSYETLGTEGHPRYQNAWSKVEKIEKTGERKVRITFKPEVKDREMALIMGMRPVLEKAQWEGHNFASTTNMAPIGSGPYVVGRVDPGKFIELKRNPDYWGKDLGFNKGRNNFDTIRYDYFGDGGVVFEAFKGGETDSYTEWNAADWGRNYNFPAVQSGDVIKSEIPNGRPSGIKGLVMNTRNPVFADWRVRQAMIDAFNFEFINKTINGGAEPRISSYFSNSELGMKHGPAEGKVKALLEPFADQLPPGTIDGYSLPTSDGGVRNRKNMRAAAKLLEDAGWQVDSDGVLKKDGKPFTFEIVLQQGAAETQSIVDIYTEALKKLGIFPKVTVIDDAQYTQRTNAYDFDMAWYWRALSLSPGNEQNLYWGSKGVKEPGSRNWMGMNSPAAEAMVKAMLDAKSHEDFVAATHALDRVLTAGRYVIPIWYAPVDRIAHIKQLHYPEKTPLYGAWPGFQPDVWWYQEAGQ